MVSSGGSLSYSGLIIRTIANREHIAQGEIAQRVSVALPCLSHRCIGPCALERVLWRSAYPFFGEECAVHELVLRVYSISLLDANFESELGRSYARTQKIEELGAMQ